MSRHAWILALIVAASGCGKKDQPSKKQDETSPTAPARAAASGPPSALWLLAPEDAVAGAVIVDGALPRLRAALAEVERILRVRPGGELLADQMRRGLKALPVDVLDPKSVTAMGLDLERGAAVFGFANGEAVFVLPVADRAAFRSATGAAAETVDGREVDRLGDVLCAPVGDRFACAATTARLDSLGKSPTSGLATKLPTLPIRGEIEMVADLERLPELTAGMSKVITDVRTAAAAVKLTGGGATLRLWLQGAHSPIGAMLTAPPSNLPAKALDGQPAGLFRIGVSTQAILAAAGSAADQQIGPGMTLKSLIGMLTGELIVHAPSAADPLIAIELGVREAAPLAKLVDAACAKLATTVPGVAVQGKDGRCAGTIDFAKLAEAAGPEAGLPSFAGGPVPISVTVEPERVRVEFRAPTPRPSATLATSPIGRELATDQWGFAMWGQALHYNLPDDVGGVFQQLISLAPGQTPPWLPSLYFATLHIYEFGYAVGGRPDGLHMLIHLDTFAGDPADVYHDYENALVQALDGDNSGAAAAFTALAKRAPDSRAGHQITTHGGGGVVTVGAVGMLAAVSIPAFVKYMRKSKSSEARILVRQIQSGAEAYRAEHGAYPPSTPLTPADPTRCCERCAPDLALWQKPGWMALTFSVDEPHYYAYQFENLGDRAVARAIGDLDCDGITSTFEIRWSADGGQPELFVDQELE